MHPGDISILVYLMLELAWKTPINLSKSFEMSKPQTYRESCYYVW